MLKLLLSFIPLALVILILIIGFCLGFTAYAVILQINVRKGRAFVIDRNGQWQPFDPRGLDKTTMIYGTLNLPYEPNADGVEVLIDGQTAPRWNNLGGEP
jgi:hypothetical protein